MIGYMFCEETEMDAKQEQALLAFGCGEIIKDKAVGTVNEAGKNNLDMLVKKSDSVDKVVFYSLLQIEKSIIQIAEILQRLVDSDVEVEVLERQYGLSSADYIQFIIDLATMEKEVIRRRTSRGLEEARRNGRIGGRPRVSNEVVDSILSLYKSNKYTLRQIAERTGVSLGTAYKYIQLETQLEERAKAKKEA